MPYKVFISHSARPEDWALINQILQRAALSGVQCYMAEHDVQAGIGLREKLHQRIREADCVLAIITKNSLKSDWVKWEVGSADGLGKLVIPIVEKEVPVPPFLLGKEYIQFDPYDPTSTAHAVSEYLLRLKIAQDERQLVGWGLLSVLGLLALFGGEDEEKRRR